METHARLLLVEGQDDHHVVRHIRDRHGLIPSFSISSRGSVEQVLRAIPIEALTSGRQALGIIIDANSDPQARWNAITYRLHAANMDIAIPPATGAGGTVIQGIPRIGIWLMPDNRSQGELEDFVAEMIPSDDPVWPRAQDYIDGIPQDDRKFAPQKTSRAKVHAWLAAREDPRQMGAAIGTRDLNIDGTLCIDFINWLDGLFA